MFNVRPGLCLFVAFALSVAACAQAAPSADGPLAAAAAPAAEEEVRLEVLQLL
jgi:hypothetical protein